MKPLFAKNLAANSAHQALAFGLNLVALPIYLTILGPESYALVGFGLTVQIWTQLLDAGMTPVLSREMTRMRSGNLEEADVLGFVRALDWIVIALVSGVSLAGILSRDWWAQHWFDNGSVPAEIVAGTVALIIVFSLLRWAGGIYRGALMGLERQVLASSIAAAANTVRLLLPIPLLMWAGDVRLLFLLWVVCSAVELAAFRVIVSKAFSKPLPFFRFPLNALRPRLRLGANIAFLSAISIVVMQSDKLILSTLLPMEAFGHFSLVAVLSSGMTMVVYPIVQAVQPKLTAEASTGDVHSFRETFLVATNLVVLALLVPAIVVAALPFHAVYAWTGDMTAASEVAPYAGIYLLGTALTGLTALIYTVQLAHGDIRAHTIASVILAVLIIPAMIFTATTHGAYGAAFLWLCVNIAMAAFYFPFTLVRFVPGEALDWYVARVGVPAAAAGAIALAARWFAAGEVESRGMALLLLIGTGIAALVAASMVTQSSRSRLLALVSRVGLGLRRAQNGG